MCNLEHNLIGLITNMDVQNKEDQEIVDAISKLKGLKVLGKENTSDAKALYKEAYGLVSSNSYEELMSVRDDDHDMKFFIRESGGKINELLMVMGGKDDFMLLSLFGEIDLKQISRIGRKMNVDGLK